MWAPHTTTTVSSSGGTQPAVFSSTTQTWNVASVYPQREIMAWLSGSHGTTFQVECTSSGIKTHNKSLAYVHAHIIPLKTQLLLN